MRSREQSIAIAERILENYRRNAKKYGYLKPHGVITNNETNMKPKEVEVHNAYLKQKGKKRRRRMQGKE